MYSREYDGTGDGAKINRVWGRGGYGTGEANSQLSLWRSWELKHEIPTESLLLLTLSVWLLQLDCIHWGGDLGMVGDTSFMWHGSTNKGMKWDRTVEFGNSSSQCHIPNLGWISNLLFLGQIRRPSFSLTFFSLHGSCPIALKISTCFAGRRKRLISWCQN